MTQGDVNDTLTVTTAKAAIRAPTTHACTTTANLIIIITTTVSRQRSLHPKTGGEQVVLLVGVGQKSSFASAKAKGTTRKPRSSDLAPRNARRSACKEKSAI